MGLISRDRVAELPSPVRRSLERSGVLDRPIPTSVTVHQRGEIRSSAEARWLAFTAVERYTLDPPSFVWNASLKVGGIGIGRARDALDRGRGSIKVRLLGVIPLVDASGPEMDQGALMRWLNETMWFPAIWATDVMAWQSIDVYRARGRVTVDGLEAEAEFVFDPDGRLVDFHADRFRSVDRGFVMTPWSTPLSGHAPFGGVELPSAGRAVWALDGGDLEYVRLKVTDVEYAT